MSTNIEMNQDTEHWFMQWQIPSVYKIFWNSCEMKHINDIVWNLIYKT